jgi:hypothetical protein
MTTDVIQALIQGLVDSGAAVDAAKAVIKRHDDARKMLRDAMIEAEQLEAIDEVSGYKAVLKHQQRDVYVAEKLLPLLRPEMADDVMVTSVDANAVQDLVDGGIITRPQMEREGALLREAKTRPFIKLVAIKGVRP